MASPKPKVSLKLLIDKKNSKVMFAEAGKEFVDFLFSLFSLPLGTIIKLLDKDGMVGCLGDLYQSIEDLSETYIQPGQSKDPVLNPKSAICNTSPATPLLSASTESSSRKLFICSSYSYGHLYASESSEAKCPSCKGNINKPLNYVAPSAANVAAGDEGGFVKGVVTYMVMDNLMVSPMSTISGIALLNEYNVPNLGALEQKTVNLGMAEGLELLKASFETKTVLTSVFMSKKRKR